MLKIRTKYYARCVAPFLRTLLCDSEFFVFTYFLFEEICFAFQRDKVHKREWILRVINLIFYIIILKLIR